MITKAQFDLFQAACLAIGLRRGDVSVANNMISVNRLGLRAVLEPLPASGAQWAIKSRVQRETLGGQSDVRDIDLEKLNSEDPAGAAECFARHAAQMLIESALDRKQSAA